MTTKKSTKPKRGKPTNLYLREVDVAKIRELTAFIAGHGDRTSDSLIVRAATHLAAPGPRFLDAYRQVASADLRFKKE
jgi:hypothetical protein